jgi:hypothetical protein
VVWRWDLRKRSGRAGIAQHKTKVVPPLDISLTERVTNCKQGAPPLCGCLIPMGITAFLSELDIGGMKGDAISKRHRASEAKQSTSFMRVRRLAIETYMATRPSRRHAVHNVVQKQLPRPRCFQEASSINSWFDCSATPATPKRPVGASSSSTGSRGEAIIAAGPSPNSTSCAKNSSSSLSKNQAEARDNPLCPQEKPSERARDSLRPLFS